MVYVFSTIFNSLTSTQVRGPVYGKVQHHTQVSNTLTQSDSSSASPEAWNMHKA